VLFQGGALFSTLTVGENVEAPLKKFYPDLSDELRREIARYKVLLSGLPEEAVNKYPSELSGGMKKRAGLARALALDPELLFLDEPTAGLDPIGAAKFDRLTVDLRDTLGLTVFLITHDLDTLYEACDRVAVIAEKKIIAVGTIPELVETGHPWIEEYFNGPRGRAAQASHERSTRAAEG
jgi:phospholipid/cholesterol/gamma-HCH transport system ATP-binding protein